MDGGAHPQVGDELVEINKIKVTANRGQALAELRKGGAASCRFSRPNKPSDTLAVAGIMPEAVRKLRRNFRPFFFSASYRPSHVV